MKQFNLAQQFILLKHRDIFFNITPTTFVLNNKAFPDNMITQLLRIETDQYKKKGTPPNTFIFKDNSKVKVTLTTEQHNIFTAYKITPDNFTPELVNQLPSYTHTYSIT